MCFLTAAYFSVFKTFRNRSFYIADTDSSLFEGTQMLIGKNEKELSANTDNIFCGTALNILSI
jgi:hypothetical protein